MGILDDLIKEIDEEQKLDPKKGAEPTPHPEEPNTNGKPSDWYSDEFKKFAGME